MSRRRYPRRPTPARQDDGCLAGLVTIIITWTLCLLAVAIAIALR